MIRLLLVDDSITQREILRRLITGDGEFTVVAEARNGREAVELAEKHRPDVVLMDIHMPDMDGVAATREIMRRCPVPIVIASATLKKRDVDLGLEALQAGAVSVIEKPEGAVLLNLTKMGPQLREELLAASQARVSRVGAGRAPAQEAAADRPADRWTGIEVIGVCASTGGPPVLSEIIAALPGQFPVPILLVQHISASFVEGFAHWLENTTAQPVRLARDGQPLGPGVWVSPGERHLALESNGRLELRPPESKDLHCPSGNVLFESMARTAGSKSLGVLLTGMGDDGARGLLALKQAGGRTIVQDEDSSLIWGMPKAGRDLGAAQRELSPSSIARALKELAKT